MLAATVLALPGGYDDGATAHAPWRDAGGPAGAGSLPGLDAHPFAALLAGPLLPEASAADYCGGPYKITGPNRATLRFNEPWYVYWLDGRYRDIHIDGEEPGGRYQTASRGRPLSGWCADSSGHYIPNCPSHYVSVEFRGPPVSKAATGWMGLHRDQYNSFYPCTDQEPSSNYGQAVTLQDGQAPRLIGGSSSYLDLDRGVLHLAFDDTISSASVSPALLSVGYEYRFWETRSMFLGGAAVASGNVPSVQLNLTDSQLSELTRLIMDSPYVRQLGANLPAEIVGNSANNVFVTMPNAFATDPAGNRVHSHSRFNIIALRPDLQPPTLAAPPELNMTTGMLKFRFDSSMDASSTADMSGIIVRGNSGAAIPLAGAIPPAADGRDLNVTLAPSHILAAAAAAADAAAAGLGPTYTIDVPAGTFFDHSGNGFGGAANASLTVHPDTTGPSLAPFAEHTLHVASGRMTLWLSEVSDASRTFPGLLQIRSAQHGRDHLDMSLAGAAVGATAADAGDSSGAVTLELTLAQRSELALHYREHAPAGGGGTVAVAVGPDPYQIHVGPGALADLSGNPVGDSTAVLSIDPLSIPPVLLDGSGAGRGPTLDLSNGTLDMEFDSDVDVSAIDMSAITIRHGEAGAGAIHLGGAEVLTGSDSQTIRISLARAQRDAAVLAAPPLLLDVSGEAFRAAHGGNAYPGASGMRMSVAPDVDPPSVAGKPHMDLGSRKLSIVFDETVDVSSANLSLVRIEGAGGSGSGSGAGGSGSGGNGMLLLGASVSSTDSTVMVITLTVEQDARVLGMYQNASGLQVSIGAGVVSDLAGNPAGAHEANVDVQPDRVRPHLVLRPIIDLEHGLLTIVLHEYIDVSRTDTGSMTVVYNHRRSVPLVGSQVVTTDDGPMLTIKLTPGQLDQVARHTTGHIALSIGGYSILDLSGNPIARVWSDIYFINRDARPGGRRLPAGCPRPQHVGRHGHIQVQQYHGRVNDGSVAREYNRPWIGTRRARGG